MRPALLALGLAFLALPVAALPYPTLPYPGSFVTSDPVCYGITVLSMFGWNHDELSGKACGTEAGLADGVKELETQVVWWSVSTARHRQDCYWGANAPSVCTGDQTSDGLLPVTVNELVHVTVDRSDSGPSSEFLWIGFRH